MPRSATRSGGSEAEPQEVGKQFFFYKKRTKKILLFWAMGVGEPTPFTSSLKFFCFFLFTKRSSFLRPFWPPGFKTIGAGAGGFWIEDQPVGERWKGAGSAFLAVTEAAGEADADRGCRNIDAVAIGKVGAMGDVATHGNDVGWRRVAPAGWTAGDGTGKAQEGLAVGQLRDLNAGDAGGSEGGVDDPARAGAPEAHEREAGC
jgi:hypothetical protein